MIDCAVKTNLNALSIEEKQALYRTAYENPGVFDKLIGGERKEFNCEKYSLLFRESIQSMLVEKNIVSKFVALEALHEHISPEMKAYNFDDGVNKISTFFYETNAEFEKIYLSFIKDFIYQHILPEDFYFQATPTLRLHCPNAENSHHYPRYHSDIGYGHPPEEINIWLPLTEFKETHGFKIIGLENSKKLLESYNYDFYPFIADAINNKSLNATCESMAKDVTCPFGNVLLFDSRCVHSGEPLTVQSRVSMDIRIIRVKEYANCPIEYQGAGRRKILFAPGKCYNSLSAKQL